MLVCLRQRTFCTQATDLQVTEKYPFQSAQIDSMKKSATNLSFAIGGVLAGVIVATIAMTLVFGPEFFSLRDAAQSQDVSSSKMPGSIPSQGISEDSFTNYISLQQVLEIPDEFDRKGAFYKYLSEIADEEALPLVEEIKQLDESLDRKFLLHAAIDRLASADLHLAFEQLQGLDPLQRTSITTELLNKYARNDPQRTKELVQQLKEEPQIISTQVYALSGEELTAEQMRKLLEGSSTEIPIPKETWVEVSRLKAMEPEKAWNEVITQVGTDIQSFTVAMNVAAPWVMQEGLVALKKIVSSDVSRSVRTDLLDNLAEIAFSHDPEGVLVFLQDYPDRYDTPYSATNRVLRKWTTTDPHAAVAAATKLDNETSSTELREKTLKAWASQEPEKVWEYLSNQPRNIREQVRSTVLFHMTRESPEKALALVDEIENVQERARMSQIAFSHWAHNSPRSALDWLSSQPEERQSFALASQAIRYLTEKNPRAAIDFTLSTNATYKDELQLQAIRTMADSDVELAIESLPLLSQDIQVEAGSYIGKSMLEYDPSRAISFGQNLDRNEQDRYYQSLIRSLDADHIDSFLQVIEELPTNELVSLASQTLLTRYSQGNRLSSEQKTYLRERLLTDHEKILNENSRFIR